jgi:hypothetical protein
VAETGSRIPTAAPNSAPTPTASHDAVVDEMHATTYDSLTASELEQLIADLELKSAALDAAGLR